MSSLDPHPPRPPDAVPVTADGGSDDAGLFGWAPAVWTAGSPWSEPKAPDPGGNDSGASRRGGDDSAEASGTEGEESRDPEIGTLIRVTLGLVGGNCLAHLDALDPEGVRHTRAGLRRIRSHLRAFRRILDPAWVVATRAEVSWYSSLLGPVRDVDVLAERIGRVYGEDLGEELLGEIFAVLELARELALAPLAVVAAGERRRHLERRLGGLGGVPLRGRSGEPALGALPPILARQWRDLRDAARAARHDPSETNRAAVRLRTRRLRHTAEVAAPLLGSRLEKVAGAAEVLGEGLGEVHDAGACRVWLEDLARLRPHLGYVAGRLSMAEEKAAGELAGDWFKDFREVRRQWRRWGPV